MADFENAACRPLAAVLAGGAGSRLGGAKPSTLLAGLPLIAYPIAAAVAGGLDVVVVAKRDSRCRRCSARSS